MNLCWENDLMLVEIEDPLENRFWLSKLSLKKVKFLKDGR